MDGAEGRTCSFYATRPRQCGTHDQTSKATASACWNLVDYNPAICGGTVLRKCWDKASNDKFVCAEFASCNVDCEPGKVSSVLNSADCCECGLDSLWSYPSAIKVAVVAAGCEDQINQLNGVLPAISEVTAMVCWHENYYSVNDCGYSVQLLPCWEQASKVDFNCMDFARCGVTCPGMTTDKPQKTCPAPDMAFDICPKMKTEANFCCTCGGGLTKTGAPTFAPGLDYFRTEIRSMYRKSSF